MSDDTAYKLALERRDKLLKELEQVMQFIDLYETMFGGPGESTSSRVEAVRPISRRPARNPIPPARIAELSAQIIAEQGRPMTRSELVDSLETRGIKLVAKDPSKNVGTILWRHEDTFVNLPGWGYWLRDQPFPPAGYAGGGVFD